LPTFSFFLCVFLQYFFYLRILITNYTMCTFYLISLKYSYIVWFIYFLSKFYFQFHFSLTSPSPFLDDYISSFSLFM
jgi:hypothetical protein